MVCSFVQQANKFRQLGCPNCEFLEMQGADDAHIADCTSAVFEGLIALADPSQSWVAKWQRLDAYVPGMYATKVAGIVSFSRPGSLKHKNVFKGWWELVWGLRLTRSFDSLGRNSWLRVRLRA